jgi:hypothetical protein
MIRDAEEIDVARAQRERLRSRERHGFDLPTRRAVGDVSPAVLPGDVAEGEGRGLEAGGVLRVNGERDQCEGDCDRRCT